MAMRPYLVGITAGTIDNEAAENTPMRWRKAFEEMTAGYGMDPAEILSKQFRVASDGLVVVQGIDFVSLCEHHLLPFSGTVSVAYLPVTDATGHASVVGLSKIPRVVDCFAQRLQLQERMTTEIGEAIYRNLSTVGVAVKAVASHGCMAHRGVAKPNARMVTQYLSGRFRESPLREEILGTL
jgi:GTP cyclohydrolase I